MTIQVINLAELVDPGVGEYARLCERIMVAGNVGFEDAEAALNLIFYAGGRTSSPWVAPHVLLDVFEGELRKGTSLPVAVRACISATVIEALERHLAEARH